VSAVSAPALDSDASSVDASSSEDDDWFAVLAEHEALAPAQENRTPLFSRRLSTSSHIDAQKLLTRLHGSEPSTASIPGGLISESRYPHDQASEEAHKADEGLPTVESPLFSNDACRKNSAGSAEADSVNANGEASGIRGAEQHRQKISCRDMLDAAAWEDMVEDRNYGRGRPRVDVWRDVVTHRTYGPGYCSSLPVLSPREKGTLSPSSHMCTTPPRAPHQRQPIHDGRCSPTAVAAHEAAHAPPSSSTRTRAPSPGASQGEGEPIIPHNGHSDTDKTNADYDASSSSDDTPRRDDVVEWLFAHFEAVALAPMPKALEPKNQANMNVRRALYAAASIDIKTMWYRGAEQRRLLMTGAPLKRSYQSSPFLLPVDTTTSKDDTT